jgi:hypothetical protein
MSDARQLSLISVEEVLAGEAGGNAGGFSLSPKITEGEESGRYTAGRLRSRKPEIARAATALLHAGYGLQEVADTLGLHFYTIQALAADQPTAVAVGKKQTARLAGHVGRRALERIQQFIETHGIKDWADAQRAATVAGISLDKAQVLDGEPSAIVQHSGPSLLDAADLLKQLVSPGEDSAQKGGGGDSMAAMMASGPGVLVAAVRRSEAVKADKKADKILASVDCQEVTTAQDQTTNLSSGDSSAAADAGAGDQDRGRGGSRETAGASNTNESDG